MEFIIVLVVGMVMGSFLNVCIYRIPRGISIIFPRSFCPNCQKRLENYDLIPVFSFLILRGRCRNCNVKIDLQYPLVELLTGILTLLGYLKFGMAVVFLKYLILAYLLIVIAVIDLKVKRIPNILTIPGLVIGLLWAVFNGRAEFFDSILGMLIGGGVLFLITYFFPQGMGMGDVKLLGFIGAFLGVRLVLLTLFIGSMLGTLIGLGLIFAKVITRKTPIPFGPFLATGAVMVTLFI